MLQEIRNWFLVSHCFGVPHLILCLLLKTISCPAHPAYTSFPVVRATLLEEEDSQATLSLTHGSLQVITVHIYDRSHTQTKHMF
jgi:hypothetical protein